MTTTKFTARTVQELRQRTGAGMMECKRALEETEGDVDAAVEYLRRKGISKAEKRAAREASEGQIGSYIHHNGKVGVLVEVNCETDFVARNEEFMALVRSIAEHIAAGVPAPPIAIHKDGVPPEQVDRERRILEDQAKASGKPDNVVAKMVEGRIRKFYEEVVLLEQPWVRDDSRTIGDLLREASAKMGENIVIRRFARYRMGEE
ncbi:MAG: translation elongation factor Ts [Gemmatimonadaceae bacterium]